MAQFLTATNTLSYTRNPNEDMHRKRRSNEDFVGMPAVGDDRSLRGQSSVSLDRVRRRAEVPPCVFRSVADVKEGCSPSGGRGNRLGAIGNSIYRAGRSSMCSG